MKATTLAISIILILVPLAGCSGTDTEVNVDLSNEDINDLIDENLEDVMNNTTVVVFQEYHNNTTVINHNTYSNNTTTNVDESGASTSTTTYNYNGSSEEDIRMFTVQWNPEQAFGDPVNSQLLRPFCQHTNWYDYDCFEWDYGYDSILGEDDSLIDDYDISTLYVYQYNGQVVEISATCTEFYQYYRWGDNDWEGFLANNYGYSSSEIEDAAMHLESKFQSPWNYDSYDEQCGSGSSDWQTLFEIDLETGTAMEFLYTPDLTIDINCDDGFGTGIGNHTESYLIGGQANCTVSGSTKVSYSLQSYSNYYYEEANNTDWEEHGLELSGYYHQVPVSFAVYFELHPVTVHQ